MTSETANYSDQAVQIANFCRAIGHPARIAILMAIARNGNVVEGEVVEIPQLSRTTVIQHLRELKRAGLIQGKIFGTKSSYSVDTATLRSINALIADFFEEMQKNHRST